MKTMRKHWVLITITIAAVLAAAVYFRFFFVFGEGVKSGELNYVVYKGVLFKTYEGKLIQTGIRSKAAGSIQSYEFEFSVENEALARELMLQGGGKDARTALQGVFRGAALAGLHEVHRRQHRHRPSRGAGNRIPAGASVRLPAKARRKYVRPVNGPASDKRKNVAGSLSATFFPILVRIF